MKHKWLCDCDICFHQKKVLKEFTKELKIEMRDRDCWLHHEFDKMIDDVLKSIIKYDFPQKGRVS